MSSLNEVRAERLKKLQILKDHGIDPYPSTSTRTHRIHEVIDRFAELAKSGTHITIAGRVMVTRGQGAILFADVQEGAEKIQIVMKEDVTDAEAFALFRATVDHGDFIECSGTLMTTQRGEKSLLVSSWRMLAKSLLPLPDKYHGLQNEDERMRKRYLDILTRPELSELFKRKEMFWDVTRTFMKAHGFMEVDTPTLELTTGGAEARPFKTHHNDYDVDVYLRISVGELWQKRLLAAGFEKTFEIGRVYRNEGTSPEHLQEFTNCEFYWAYANYRDGMQLARELYLTLAQTIYGTTRFEARGHVVDLANEWNEIDYADEIERQTGIDIMSATESEMRARLDALGVLYQGTNRERLIDTLWKHCRKNIAGPAFLVHHPALVAPLAKIARGGATVEIFQPIIAGSEVGKGYSELNDPLDQRRRFDIQKKLLEEGDEEAMMPDEDFIEMLEHGMPPACGFGFGERLFAIFENRPLRETQFFPLTRLKHTT